MSSAKMPPRQPSLWVLLYHDGFLRFVCASFAVVCFAHAALKVAWATDSPVCAVGSGSMAPAINVGDLVFVSNRSTVSFASGDVVVYRVRGGNC